MAEGSSVEVNNGDGGGGGGGAGHPYDFHVAGPRSIAAPTWRDLLRSSWKNPSYRRMVIACFIQAVYLLELDRQAERRGDRGLAPQWWKPFKYKLSRTLIDARDNSVYGAVLERDRSAALSDFIPVRPSGAPRAVLALRGTLIKSATVRRDVEDDLRFLAWESLSGSVRFSGALEALKTAVDRHGSSGVCVGGHSLGAGFALQVGKALAKRGVFVECHLFNPPSVSPAVSLRSVGEKLCNLWKRVKGGEEGKVFESEVTRLRAAEVQKWMPHLYVNDCDYVCCYYNDQAAGSAVSSDHVGSSVAKLYVMSRGPTKFLEAHGLQQWWSDDAELELALRHGRLINRQFRSLYSA
ncbi:GDSL esterase/lipase At4g10955-like [Ananas comosus]|uniref:GDSL esterase/lipase n=1 Tax=Ananas comosus TaxID=4615 RepID=A0A199VFX4_ANACO|nr:GDSL esterase/lipase At4g10955-like [Ananas comosus]OAY76017.1 GDSL esterase/lipase [Ananas comosus]